MVVVRLFAVLRRRWQALPGLRRAEPGEFTRRAFLNGRIDLNEAEGLADLLTAETEWQRRAALQMAGGAFSKAIEGWREALLGLSATVEALLDFSDEDDVGEKKISNISNRCIALHDVITHHLAPHRRKSCAMDCALSLLARQIAANRRC